MSSEFRELKESQIHSDLEIGGWIRSLNVALRQMLDLYVCLRPVRWFSGVPSPVKHPESVGGCTLAPKGKPKDANMR